MNVFVFRNKIDLSFIKVNPGEWVVLKPNFVKENLENNVNEWECVITSPVIIKTVCEYVCEQLQGKGKVTICDAPQTDSSFSKIAERLNLYQIAEDCKNKYNVTVEVVDLRNEEWENVGGVITARKKLKGDPQGAVLFNLGKDSLFYKHKGEGKYYGADYDTGFINDHHKGLTQEYLVSATPILADVFINLPKMKTHKKTGVTLSLKNLVGILADKNYLPHHTVGSPNDGGDQFPDMTLFRKLENISSSAVRKIALNIPYIGPKLAIKMRRSGTKIFGSGDKVIRSGNWYMNDTTWRMALDLNRCLLYGNPDGTLRKTNSKRYYTIIDGIRGMEGNGPMQGSSIESNIVIAGTDPVATDIVASKYMGFDWNKIPIIREALKLKSYPISNVTPDDIEIESDLKEWNLKFSEFNKKDFMHFKPHFGWIGQIEH